MSPTPDFSTAIITQARMGSTRLPSKILLKSAGNYMLDYHLQRLQKSGLPIIVATTDNPNDDTLAEYCTAHRQPFFRGSEHDVLQRYWACARQFGINTIIRVTSDCPLIDGELIRQAVMQFQQLPTPENCYLSNTHWRTYPRGFDIEIFHRQALETAYQNAQTLPQREHVTPYLYQNPQQFRQLHFARFPDRNSYRITLDTPSDFALLDLLIDQQKAHTLSSENIIALLDQHPEWVAINAHIEQKKLG